MQGPSGAGGTVTPEGVALDLEHATVGSRGIAYLLDLLAMGSLLLLFGLAESIFGVSGFVPGWLGLALLLLFVFAVLFGYPIGFETFWRGRTPGKAALGLRVVTTEGAPVGFRHATVRAVVGLVELLPTMGVPAMVSSLLNGRGQRLGDLAAGTVVLRVRRGSRAPVAHAFAPPAGLEDYTARLDVSALGSADYATVRETLLRLGDLAPGARREVTEVVADALLGRVAPPPPAGVPAEVWLVCVAAAVQRRRPATTAGPAADPTPPAPSGREHGRSGAASGPTATPDDSASIPPPAARTGDVEVPDDGFRPPQ
ncbi:RDD family protein [Egicoccus halophilus]|uniref:RDD domain-containing protein n=1 Tax=Egicoccus halophilus TaxID=1670830 RepID=A0A8J3ERG3_9ACTN|nr:RDD family protein [Egicoccus halophilus]GGI04901.1 hypothetical protein GCM10011354_11410 [Egicoccus halophilus]